MTKTKITTTAQLEEYGQRKLQEFDDCVAMFKRIYDTILHDKIDMFTRSKILKKHEQFKNLLTTIPSVAPEDIPKFTKRIDNGLAAGIKLYKEIEAYDLENGPGDRLVIEKVQREVAESYKNFKEVWKPLVKNSLASNRPDQAAQLVVNLPYFHPHVTGHFFTGLDKLCPKYVEINDWVKKVRQEIPRDAWARAKVKQRAIKLDELAQEITPTVEKFAAAANALGALRGESYDDVKSNQQVRVLLKELDELLDRQQLLLNGQQQDMHQLREQSPGRDAHSDR